MNDSATGAGAGIGVVVVLVFGLGAIGGLVFWIVALVDCARRPEAQFRAAGSEKVMWVLVVALAGWIGGLIYWLAQRRRLIEVEAAGPAAYGPYGGGHGPYGGAYGQYPAVPPGWYADPLGPGLRWRDGTRWTEHVADRPGP